MMALRHAISSTAPSQFPLQKQKAKLGSPRYTNNLCHYHQRVTLDVTVMIFMNDPCDYGGIKTFFFSVRPAFTSGDYSIFKWSTSSVVTIINNLYNYLALSTQLPAAETKQLVSRNGLDHLSIVGGLASFLTVKDAARHAPLEPAIS